MDLKSLVDGFEWHGSYFPIDQCLAELSAKVPSDQYGELRELINARAKRHDETLEG